MNQFEESTESFVVKIWADETAESTQWNGQITHVTSGEGTSFQNLEKIKTFIKAYLKKQTFPQTLWRFFHATPPPAIDSPTQSADKKPA